MLLAGFYGNIFVLFFPVALLIAGPTYGLRYFLDIPSDITFALISAIICYILSLLGLLAGPSVKNQSKNDES